MFFIYALTLLITFFHLINWIKGHVSFLSKNKLTLPFLLFFISQLISTFFSVNSHTSVFGYYSRLNGGLLSLIAYFSLFLILPQYITPKFRHKFINTILLSGLLISIYGILQHFGIADKGRWEQDVQTRVFSSLGQPNWLAAYLCILLPITINKFLSAKNFLQKSSFLFLVSSFYLCLLFTKSKSGIIAAIISIGVYFIFYFVKNFKNSTVNKVNFNNTKDNQFKKEIPPLIKGGWGVFIILIIFAILSLSISNPIKDYLFPPKISPPIDQSNTLNITPSEDIRKIVWTGSLDLWKRFPLFGTGPETFAFSYYWTRPISHNLTSEWDYLYNKAHNEYLNYLATTGTLGFLTYLFFIATIIILLIKRIFSPPLSKEGPGVDLYLTILASFISILITNFAGFSVAVISLFFFLFPLLVLDENPNNTNQKSKNKWLFLPLLIIFIFLFIKLSSFYTADLAYNQSLKAYKSQQLASSNDFINVSLALRPKEATYQSFASLVSANLKQTDSAVTHSNLAVSLSPASTNLWKERAQVFSILSLTDPNYFSYAIDALEKCSRLAPTDAKVFYLLGRFYQAAAKNDLSQKNYQKALEIKSNYDHAAFALGEIYFTDKNYSEAKKYFEITLKIAPTSTEAQNYLSLIATASAKHK